MSLASNAAALAAHKARLESAAASSSVASVVQSMTQTPVSVLPVINLEDVVDKTTDLIHEEAISRNKYSLAGWWRYIREVTNRFVVCLCL